MARCELCYKSPRSGNNVSFSKRRTKTKWMVNIQRATIYVDGVARSARICTRCIRTQQKTAARN